MLQTVDVGQRSIDDYQQIAPAATLEELRRVAKDPQGARMLELNATPYGGGVSEVLRSAVPCWTASGWSGTGGSSAETTRSSR
jgi:trehalose synthase